MTAAGSDTALRLVAIGADGRPEEPLALSEMAEQVCSGTAQLYARTGYEPPWIGYLALLGGDVVGTCAFKTPPAGGRAELAYFTFPEFEGRGIATRMGAALIAVARAADASVQVTARTRPEEGPSPAILRKLGFTLVGEIEDPEDGPVWEWELRG